MSVRYNILKYLSLITGNSVYKNFREELSWDGLSLEEIEGKQGELLKKLLAHAYHKTVYYKEIFDDIGLISEGKVDLSKFTNVPILNKDILRNRFKSLLTSDWRELGGVKNTSGGSTGEPAVFMQDKNYRAWNLYANKLYFNHMLGKEMGEKEINLWGSERDILRGGIGLKQTITNFLYNRLFLNSFVLTEVKMAEFVEKINSFRPKSLWCYADSIYELATYIKKVELNVFSPQIIISTAGVLYPHMRELIEGVFHTKVYNQYGSREVGPVCCQCKEQEAMHFFPWSHYIELVDDNYQEVMPGEEGKILVTVLTNKCMPIIRYEIGDTAIKSNSYACSCGRNTAKIKAVTGRVGDHFTRPDGVKVHGEYITHLFYYRSWAKNLQVIQKDYDKVVCKVVKSCFPPTSDLEDIKSKIKKVMGNNCEVRFDFVDKIDPSKSGKHLYIVNEMEQKIHGD